MKYNKKRIIWLQVILFRESSIVNREWPREILN
jgi:hypothetical protein